MSDVSVVKVARVVSVCMPHPVHGPVHGRNDDTERVDTAQRSIQQECCKTQVVLVSNTIVDPWTMMVHLHDASETHK